MSKLKLLASVTQSVLPTPTTLFTAAVEQYKQLTVEVENLDGSQTLDVQVWRRASTTGSYSLSPLDLLSGIQPGESRCVDFDISGTLFIQLRATASGIGLSCRTAGTLIEATL
jgi:hypothetical protein